MEKSNSLSNSHAKKEDVLGLALSKSQVYEQLQASPKTFAYFKQQPSKVQEKVVSFLMGEPLLPITYDNIFKKIMDPFQSPKRLESLISSILGQSVRIKTILNPEGIRLSDSGSFVIMDIIVELNDGSIMDVEIQKQGYAFPGERSNCYLSDMIMRQYNRVKKEKGIHFTYRDLKPVFLIVLMEQSPKAFLDATPHYIHREIHSYNSGASVANLSNVIYISLDTFQKNVHNITNTLEAWLTFLSQTSANKILKLVDAYPEFLEYYHEINQFRQNPKELISMFSEALAILDRNTEAFMCDELKKEVAEKQNQLAKIETQLVETKCQLVETESQLVEKESQLAQKDALIAQLQEELAKLKQ